MGFFASLFEKRNFLTSAEAVEVFGGSRTAAGVRVGVDESMSYGPVWACVRVLAESIAQLPYLMYRQEGRIRERALDHPLYWLLKTQPNPELTSFEYRELRVAQVCTWGNSFAEIEWDEAGYARALWPLRPDRMVDIRKEASGLAYYYRLPDESLRRIPDRYMSHWKGLGNGRWGWSPVRMHMESIGLGLATQEFGARFFGNGARPGGVLEHPQKLTPEAHKRLRESWAREHEGLSRSHRLKILEEGMKYHEIGIPPEEAQFLETRKYQRADIASIFRVPLHFINDLEHATFSNIEHQSTDFVVHTLTPWLVRIEQADERDLFVGQERRIFFLKHQVGGLLRGDLMSRYQSYQMAIQSGFMTRNEARELEDWNPLEGLDLPLMPLNMAEEGTADGGRRTADDGEDRGLGTGDWGLVTGVEFRAVAGERQDLARVQRGLLEDLAGRIVRRETNDIGRAVQRFLVRGDDVQGFLLWLSSWYEEHAEFIERQSLPTFEALAQLVLRQVGRELDDDGLVDGAGEALRVFAGSYVGSMALRWILGNRGQLEAIVRDGVPADLDATLADLLQERLDGWAESEAGKIATRESVQAVNAMAKASYRAAGVTRLRWVASGSENCPYCRALDGKIVGIEENFVEAGDFAPEGSEPLKVRRSVGHPPVHQGCDCSIVAA